MIEGKRKRGKEERVLKEMDEGIHRSDKTKWMYTFKGVDACMNKFGRLFLKSMWPFLPTMYKSNLPVFLYSYSSPCSTYMSSKILTV